MTRLYPQCRNILHRVGQAGGGEHGQFLRPRRERGEDEHDKQKQADHGRRALWSGAEVSIGTMGRDLLGFGYI